MDESCGPDSHLHLKAEDSGCEAAGLLRPSSLYYMLSKRKATRWRVIAISILVLLSLLGVVVLGSLVMHSRSSLRPWRQVDFHLLEEVNRMLASVSVYPVVFGPDPLVTPNHMTAASANASDEYWLSAVPRGNGFVAVEEPAQHQLPPPIRFRGKSVYSVAVFHQLHCLHTIMASYNALADGATMPEHNHASPPEKVKRGGPHGHIDHCFRYLRQSLLCCGDTALEGQDPSSDDPATDGTGAIHLCKDYEGIKRWAEERRLVDNQVL
ncbi:hypothetical protein B0T25DRAFT_547130 [Lasiosphaeria hispida]|uniref:Tat pathway signal sequence n=1 Tax=Lasiosphaeria hispida TaxID=260671 RepID=A0AAJ0HEB8_9PEZI|nr:hypothetical protein B0T25DRAFT_547130 [Lasiosphaeria hispida]